MGSELTKAQQAQNTDRELWREDHPEGEAYGYYAPSIHVTKMGGIGINVNGTIIVKSLREWHALVGRIPDPELVKVTAERDEARNLADRLKLEAQNHAQEARTANSTIYEIYQVLSGGKGEPGNWHGAEPARAYVASRTTAIKAAIEAIDAADHYIDQQRIARLHNPMRDTHEAGAAYYRAAAQLRSLIAGKETDVG